MGAKIVSWNFNFCSLSYNKIAYSMETDECNNMNKSTDTITETIPCETTQETTFLIYYF